VADDPENDSKRGRSTVIEGAGSFLLFVALSFFFFARELIGAFRIDYVGNGTDPTESMWFLRWWPYAIHNGLNPFFTKLVWAPKGTSLAWATSIPLPSFAAVPITLTFGPIAAYNVLCLAAPVLAAFAAYLLCRYITGSFWPSVLGGYIFGFSPYLLGQLLSHLDLTMVFPIPIAALALAMKYNGDLGDGAYVAMLAGALVAEFLCFPELFATMTMFGAIATILGYFILPERESFTDILIPTAVAFGVAVLVLSPYLYEMLTNSPPAAPLYSPAQYSADLLNFIIPTRTNLIGTPAPAAALTGKFRGIIYEQGACLGIPLLLIVESWRRRHWREPATKLAVLMLLIVCVAALGPVLNVAGKPTLPAPWLIFAHLPLLQVALPGRFMVYAFLLVAVIAAAWFAFSPARRWVQLCAAAALLLFMMPNLSANFWISVAQVPSFFTDGTWRNYLAPGETILPLPYERTGSSMLWQAETNMSFRMAGGYTTRSPFAFDRLPIVNFFSGAIDLTEPADHLKAFIVSKHVSAIVAAIDDPNFAIWKRVLDDLGITPVRVGGVALYQIPQDQFAQYAGLSPLRLEQRALALRLDTLIEACAGYASRGKPPGEISPLALERAGLLPASWKILDDPAAMHDYLVLSIQGRIAIAIGGSYEALEPLASRYQALAARIDYPYPRAWSRAEQYPTSSIGQPMVFEFDSKALAGAAAALKTSPPRERTIPFLEYTARGPRPSEVAIPGGARR
jgi:hypothetical protein